ncbi:hypothetical protein EDC01DRAFT_761487 [Geopyxis carbonaria]|nr:hypothetical protein EDC01DRAFT_761487 [Geopyxis carbonaria]
MPYFHGDRYLPEIPRGRRVDREDDRRSSYNAYRYISRSRSPIRCELRVNGDYYRSKRPLARYRSRSRSRSRSPGESRFSNRQFDSWRPIYRIRTDTWNPRDHQPYRRRFPSEDRYRPAYDRPVRPKVSSQVNDSRGGGNEKLTDRIVLERQSLIRTGDKLKKDELTSENLEATSGRKRVSYEDLDLQLKTNGDNENPSQLHVIPDSSTVLVPSLVIFEMPTSQATLPMSLGMKLLDWIKTNETNNKKRS